MDKTITIEQTKVRELFNTLTNYPAISKEQVINEMNKCFGAETFAPKEVTERIKTFEDACKELGENHPFVKVYYGYKNHIHEGDRNDADLNAYFKLRIIVAALNEGWEPKFTEDEVRWYPWFYLYSPEELAKLIHRAVKEKSAEEAIEALSTLFKNTKEDE